MNFNDFLIDEQINIVFAKLPRGVNGFCIVKDGWTVIYIDQNACFEKQKEICKHELIHAMENHIGKSDYRLCEDEVSMLINERAFEFE